MHKKEADKKRKKVHANLYGREPQCSPEDLVSAKPAAHALVEAGPMQKSIQLPERVRGPPIMLSQMLAGRQLCVVLLGGSKHVCSWHMQEG